MCETLTSGTRESHRDSSRGTVVLYKVGLNKGVLNRGVLSRAVLNSADLNSADLNRAVLNRAFLNRVGLNRPGLYRAFLNRGGLCREGLNRAVLYSAGLNRAVLYGAGMNRAGRRRTAAACLPEREALRDICPVAVRYVVSDCVVHQTRTMSLISTPSLVILAVHAVTCASRPGEPHFRKLSSSKVRSFDERFGEFYKG